MKKIGVVYFDNFETLSGGWASVSGSEAKRINGIGDLASSVLWVSNLPFYYYRKLNLMKNPNIYDQQFFRTSMKLIVDEVGLDGRVQDICKVCSLIFQRVYTLGVDNYQLTLDDVEYRYNSALTNCLLPSNIRQLPSGAYTATLLQGFKESTQQNQAMIGNAPKASKARTFYFPKGAYARSLLSEKMPSNTNWKKIPDKDIQGTVGTKEDHKIQGTNAFFTMLEKKFSNSSLFFRISVSYTSKFFRPFATFAMGSNYQRNWATLPELLEMSKYSVIDIHEAFSCDMFNLNVEGIDLESDEYSYSRGLYLENLWTAYALPINNGEYFNPVGAYIRAYDRVVCLKAAYAFAKNNFTIGSFGTGRVVVYLKQSEQKLATEIALSEGLLPPQYMVANDD